VPAIPPFDTLASDGVVTLRAWREDDVPAIVEACRDPEVIYWTRVPDPYDESDAHEYIAQAEKTREEGSAISTAICDADSGDYLGSIDLRLARDGRGDIGYFVAAHARRRGVATRAVKLLADYGFRKLGLGRIEIVTHPENAVSQRVAEGAGFTREAVLHGYISLRDDSRSDAVMFSRVAATERPRSRSRS
jgi:RimJ/RimL family protein N-acetyltransferase